MSIKQMAEETAKEVLTSLGSDVDKSDDVSRIIENALLTVLREARAGCVDVVQVCCSADLDLAHKIAAELRQKEQALIANLCSLR
ncbi:hypothetical protein L2D14_18175 [Thalassospiraceae bacterium LMO-JJ14]|nr:hypothetical protein L2D14_18175 [Thalassospiraceae bacterium LMO-JJ14]